MRAFRSLAEPFFYLKTWFRGKIVLDQIKNSDLENSAFRPCLIKLIDLE